MDAFANSSTRSTSIQANSGTSPPDIDALIKDFVTACKSGDMPTFEKKLTQAVNLEPAMFELVGPGCVANMLFGSTGADANPQIRTVWENALATIKNNGHVDDIKSRLNLSNYRARRLCPSISEKSSIEMRKPLIGAQCQKGLTAGTGITSNVPAYHPPHASSVNASATVAECADRSLARFELLSAEARKAFLSSDAEAYQTILAQLQAMTPVNRPNAEECAIQ